MSQNFSLPHRARLLDRNRCLARICPVMFSLLCHKVEIVGRGDYCIEKEHNKDGMTCKLDFQHCVRCCRKDEPGSVSLERIHISSYL